MLLSNVHSVAYLQVRIMSSPLLWFPGSLYLGVNCWVRVKLTHSITMLGSEEKVEQEVNSKTYMSCIINH